MNLNDFTGSNFDAMYEGTMVAIIINTAVINEINIIFIGSKSIGTFFI